VTVADVNADGKPDLIMSDGATVAVMLGLGARHFDSETHYIAGRAISKLNVVDLNGDGYPDIAVANPGGTTVTVLLNQPNGSNGKTVSGNLSVSPEPSTGGQPFTITLAVTAPNGGAVPTGSVTFSIDGTFVGEASISNGAASFTTGNTLIPVPHTVVASYNGDSRYGSRNFSVLHTVSPPIYATTCNLSTSAGSRGTLLVSHTIRLVAKVTSSVAVPPGVVTFLDGPNSLGSAVTDSNGIAQLDTALLSIGAHSLSAKFQGESQTAFVINTAYVAAIFSPSTSAPVPVAVTADATTTVLKASASSITFGSIVTFSAQVSSVLPVFGGVAFFDGSVLLGTQSLHADGSAEFSLASLSTGAHNITATFNGNGPFAASISPPVTVSVTSSAAGIKAVVALSRKTDVQTGFTTIDASISPSAVSPGDRVTFLDSGTILGTAIVESDSAAHLQIQGMTNGTHYLSASFAGNTQAAPAVTPAFKEVWPETGPGFAVQLMRRPTTTSSSTLAEFQVNLLPLGQQTAVQLSCANDLAPGYACAFAPRELESSGTATLSVIATDSARLHVSAIQAGAFIFVFAATAGNFHRRRIASLLILAVLGTVSMIAGCGDATSRVHSTQDFVVTVQAISGTGPTAILHSQQILVRTGR
jgi:hypothetical protein